jgi:late competence protein required for DNA uptake (superfamily II DNA/RNA helicase)
MNTPIITYHQQRFVKVKIPLSGNRVKILCSNCGEFKPDCETYADLEDKPFTYYCESCLMNLFH